MSGLDFFQKEILYLLEEFEDGAYVSEVDTCKLLYMNPVCRALFGVANDQDISDKFCYQVMQGKDNRCSFCKPELLSEDKYHVRENNNLYIGKQLILRDQLISWGKRLCRLTIVFDIGKDNKLEKLLSTKIHIENTLLSCISALVKPNNSFEENSLIVILGMIGKFYNADRAYILELDTNKLILHHTYEWCKNGVSSLVNKFAEVGITFSAIRQRAYENNLPIIIIDIEELRKTCPTEYVRQKLRGIQRLYVLPYYEKEVIKGYIGIDNPTLNISNFYFLKTLSLFIADQLNQYKLRQQQEYNINHDALTGLLNRNAFINFMKDYGKNTYKSLGVVAANINCLGKFNKDFGQKYGDSIVKKVADALKILFFPNTIFRFGGDECIIICRDITYSALIKQIEKTENSLKKIIYSGVTIACSWTKEEADVEKLIHDATKAMILKKQRYYEGLHKESRHNNLQLFDNLQDGLRHNRYHIYLQPKFDLQNEKLSGIEALIRYQDTMYGIMNPGTFIPLLEKEGLIRYIDFFVLEQVCRTLASWRKKGYSIVPISLNFSRLTLLESEVVESIERIVDSYEIPHSYILIEITETAGSIEQDVFVAIGTSLLEHGFGVSLDDFCSEYSCVSLLTAVPFTEIKFDKSMINQLGKNNQQNILCQKMMDMCNQLGYHVLAEGVETKEQLEILKGFSCNAVQGYFYSKPIPVQAFEQRYYVAALI